MNRRNFIKTLLLGAAAATTTGLTSLRQVKEKPKAPAKLDKCYAPSLADDRYIQLYWNEQDWGFKKAGEEVFYTKEQVRQFCREIEPVLKSGTKAIIS